MSQDQDAAPELGIVGDAPPQLPIESARAIAKAAAKLGHAVPPAAQAAIDAADAAPAKKAKTPPPAPAGSDA